MNLRITLLFSAVILAAAAGCYTGSATDTNRNPNMAVDTDDTDPLGEPPASDAGTKKKAKTQARIPCDVAELLEAECSSCHGAKPANGAPNTLLSYEDLRAPSKTDPEKSVAEIALGRMTSTARPMPPRGKLAGETISAFESWVADGLPRGTCGAPIPDAGPSAPLPPPPPTGTDPNEPTSVCTSGTTAAPAASAFMRPGGACITCHKNNGGPDFELAGTVYPTLHEPNGCNGVERARIIIIDATGATHEMQTNAAGNFIRRAAIPRPYRALVVQGNRVREMKTLQTNGDCNSCHTEFGTGSPGRIMAP